MFFFYRLGSVNNGQMESQLMEQRIGLSLLMNSRIYFCSNSRLSCNIVQQLSD